MTDLPMQRLVATARGRVQGVGYRWFVRQEAQRLHLAGWVANRSDGGVDVVAEGPIERLGELTESLRDGPPAANVDSVDVVHEPARGLSGFKVRSGAHRGD